MSEEWNRIGKFKKEQNRWNREKRREYPGFNLNCISSCGRSKKKKKLRL